MWATAEEDRYSFSASTTTSWTMPACPSQHGFRDRRSSSEERARDEHRRSRPASPTSATSRSPLPSTVPGSLPHLTPPACGSAVTRRPSGDQRRSQSVLVATTTRSALGGRYRPRCRRASPRRSHRHSRGGRRTAEVLRRNRATSIYLQILDLGDLDHLRFIAEEVAPLLEAPGEPA